MSSIEQVLGTLSARVEAHAATMATEEAVKTSVILPLLQALGYDVFNPAEVIPEFTADAVGKKGEKVDYAINLNGDIAILIEAKGITTKLDAKHLSQLYRYFSVTCAKFAILTNGQVFQFYSDLEEVNKLDSRPFFSFDLLDYSSTAVNELKKFEKGNFDVDRILATAERLKYTSAIKKFIVSEMESPGDDLVRLIASRIHEGRITAAVKETVGNATKAAFSEIIRDAVRVRLSTALDQNAEEETTLTVDPDTGDPEIETTQDEIEGMLTVRAIVRDLLDAARIDLRDAKSYCAILVDNNNRKPLARLHFNRKQWYLGLFDSDREDRVPIASLSEIYGYADRLRATASRYAQE